MPAMFEQGFFVRQPAWHGLGVVLADYPGREEAMRLAGHDWDVVEHEVFMSTSAQIEHARSKKVGGWKAHVRSDNLDLLTIAKSSFERIPNRVAYDVAEILFDQGFQFETGITLDGGRLCAITLKLDEPITITGDTSIVLPFGCLSWAHDGSAALRVRSGTIRQVCANTVAASEAEGARLGTDFTFRHTKNVHERIHDAREAIRGVRSGIEAYRDVMEELASLPVTPAQRDLFVSTIIGDRQNDGTMISHGIDTTERVKTNLDNARAGVNALFMGSTIPEAHALTGFGLFQAGVEYFEHVRRYKSENSYVKRSLITHSAEKARLRSTIRELVAA